MSDAQPHLFAARAARERGVFVLILVLLAIVAYTSWPTPQRQLEKRAAHYVDAVNGGDTNASYELLSPRARSALTAAAWKDIKQVKSELETITVDDAGSSGAVTFRVAHTGRRIVTRWVKVEGKWYRDDV